MAAIDYNELPDDDGEVTAQTQEAATPEIDQPDNANSVPYDQLFSEDAPESGAEGETGATGEQPENTGDADQQPPANQTVYRTQAEFDKAWGERTGSLRKQLEREHADDLAIASAVRRRYGAKSAAEIQDAMIKDEARELTERSDYTLEEAEQRVRARYDYERRSTLPDDVDPAIYDKMVTQVSDFQRDFGIDLVKAMQADPSLEKLVDENTGDLSKVGLAVLAKRKQGGQAGAQSVAQRVAAHQAQGQPQGQRPSVPKPERGGARSGANAGQMLSDKDFDKMDAIIESGRKIIGLR